MQRQYEVFLKKNINDMSKDISDMTYTFINPETNKPTVVPAAHFKNILSKVKEQYIEEQTQNMFLSIVYNQLKSLKENDERYFHQALMCLDLNIKPDDLRVNERIALLETQSYLNQKQHEEKKDFHLLDSSIIEYFEIAKNDPDLQKDIIEFSNSASSYNLEDIDIADDF